MEKMQLPKTLESALSEKLEEIRGGFDRYEIHFHPEKVEEIPHESCDGFIPFTNGGFALSFMSDLGLANGSGSFPEKLRHYIESAEKDALNDWKSEHPNFDIETASEEEKNEFWDHEYIYLREGAEFWYQLKVIFYSADNYRNQSGKDEILILSGVNTDFTYCRDYGLEVAYSRNLPLKGLTVQHLLDCIESAIDAI